MAFKHHDLTSTPSSSLARYQETFTAKPVSPLWTALRKKSVDLVREALAEDSEIAQMPLMDHKWEPPLCAAVRFGCSREIVSLLLEHKSDVNQCDVQGRSVFRVLLERTQGVKQSPLHEQPLLATCHPSRCPPTSMGQLNGFPTCSSIWEINWDAVPNFPDTLPGRAGGNIQPMWMETSAPHVFGFSCDQIHTSKQDYLLKVAALLLKKGCQYRVSDTSASSKTKPLDDSHDSKFMRLVHDWLDIATFGLLLYMLQKHQHDNFSNLCKLNRYNWEHVMGYITCHDTWSMTGLQLVGI